MPSAVAKKIERLEEENAEMRWLLEEIRRNASRTLSTAPEMEAFRQSVARLFDHNPEIVAMLDNEEEES